MHQEQTSEVAKSPVKVCIAELKHSEIRLLSLHCHLYRLGMSGQLLNMGSERPLQLATTVETAASYKLALARQTASVVALATRAVPSFELAAAVESVPASQPAASVPHLATADVVASACLLAVAASRLSVAELA